MQARDVSERLACPQRRCLHTLGPTPEAASRVLTFDVLDGRASTASGTRQG